MKKFSLGFFISAWLYRLYSLFNIISTGNLEDFRGYYQVGNQIIYHQVNVDTLLNISFGPPFVYIPFIPWAVLPFKVAEILFTLVNLAAFAFAVVKLWQKAGLKFTWKFWILAGLLAFSFPLIYSLGMGNPIGLVTLGIYGLWIIKDYWIKLLFLTQAILLKIFPGVAILPALLMRKEHRWNQLYPVISIIIVTIIVNQIIFPPYIFNNYHQSITKFLPQALNEIHIYNQSLIAVLGRWGIDQSIRLNLFFLSVCIGVVIVVWMMFKKTKDTLSAAILLLSLSLIIQPISWQYYFAILFPFIILKLGRGKWKYFSALLLLSIDGNKFGGILTNSQFWGTVIFVIILFSDVSSSVVPDDLRDMPANQSPALKISSQKA